MNDLLCFHAFDNVYGIPLEYVKESFVDQKITRVPRLNHIFNGLCNHKGIIYPVLSFSELLAKQNNQQNPCMLLLSIQKYQFILRIYDIPFVVYQSDIINDSLYTGGTDVVRIERLCQTENLHIYVLDMKKTLDYLYENICE